ncbi:hypothetical protein R1sor_011960 [Riccia sorocarpa]|uniref:Uncharacterized protein n=1 Tax=Riccia sorocarpa TaxID=122646 RepID=A0ABD3I4A9_9MARC
MDWGDLLCDADSLLSLDPSLRDKLLSLPVSQGDLTLRSRTGDFDAYGRMAFPVSVGNAYRVLVSIHSNDRVSALNSKWSLCGSFMDWRRIFAVIWGKGFLEGMASSCGKFCSGPFSQGLELRRLDMLTLGVHNVDCPLKMYLISLLALLEGDSGRSYRLLAPEVKFGQATRKDRFKDALLVIFSCRFEVPARFRAAFDRYFPGAYGNV